MVKREEEGNGAVGVLDGIKVVRAGSQNESGALKSVVKVGARSLQSTTWLPVVPPGRVVEQYVFRYFVVITCRWTWIFVSRRS